MPKLQRQTFETAIIERYLWREASVEGSLIEMYLAGVSVHRVEDITDALWSTRVSPNTVSELNQKIYRQMSSGAQIDALRRHPVVRTGIALAECFGSSSSLESDRLFEIPKAIAAPLDAEHVAVMEQAIEDGGGQALVAGEQLWPVLDALLVGGDQDRAAAVAVTDQAEEQARLAAAHGLEAHLVDDQQGGAQVLAPVQARGRQFGVALQGGEQLLETAEEHREVALDGGDAEGDAQVRFPHTGRALDQQRLLGADPGAGGQRLDARALHGRLERDFEARQRLAGGQRRQAQCGAHAALLACGELVVEQAVEHPVRSELVSGGLAETLGEAGARAVQRHWGRDRGDGRAVALQVREVSMMLKPIHAAKDQEVAQQKAEAVIAKLEAMKLPKAAKIVREGIAKTLTYCSFPNAHWRRIRTNNPLKRIMREIRRRARFVGAFPDGHSALMLCAARLRHIAGTHRGTCPYLDLEPLVKKHRLEEVIV